MVRASTPELAGSMVLGVQNRPAQTARGVSGDGPDGYLGFGARAHVLGDVHFSASRAIGDHNRVRQDLFRQEFVWKTANCWAACVQGFLAMIVALCSDVLRAAQDA